MKPISLSPSFGARGLSTRTTPPLWQARLERTAAGSSSRPSASGRQARGLASEGASSDRSDDALEFESLLAASRSAGKVAALKLEASPELVCSNILCESVGEACVCRLSRVLERCVGLRSLSLAKNNLPFLPPSVWDLAELGHLDLSNNALTELPPEVGRLAKLRSLRLQGNALRSLPDSLGDLLGSLEEVHLDLWAKHLLPEALAAAADARRLRVVLHSIK